MGKKYTLTLAELHNGYAAYAYGGLCEYHLIWIRHRQTLICIFDLE